MKLIQWLMSLFMKHKGKASDLMKEHGDKLDDLADKIPGDADDKILDQVKDTLK